MQRLDIPVLSESVCPLKVRARVRYRDDNEKGRMNGGREDREREKEKIPQRVAKARLINVRLGGKEEEGRGERKDAFVAPTYYSRFFLCSCGHLFCPTTIPSAGRSWIEMGRLKWRRERGDCLAGIVGWSAPLLPPPLCRSFHSPRLR